MGKGRGRPGGNPEFGSEHKFDLTGDEPLAAKQLQIRLPQSQMDRLMEMPSDERNKLVRGAIASALNGESGSDELVQEAVRDAIANKQAAISREKKKGKRSDEKLIAQWESEVERLENLEG